MAVLVGEVAAVGFDVCPLCGTKLTAAHPEHSRAVLTKGPNLEGQVPAEHPPP